MTILCLLAVFPNAWTAQAAELGETMDDAPVAASWQWDDLVKWNRDDGPTALLLQGKKQAAENELRNMEASDTKKFIGGVSLGQIKEPVTDTSERSYERFSAQAGVRWGFLGGGESWRRDMLDAKVDLAQIKLQAEVEQRREVTNLAEQYSAYLRSRQKCRVLAAFLAGKDEAEKQLAARVGKGLMLESERLALIRLFSDAAILSAREMAKQKNALRKMGYLTGKKLAPLAANDPGEPLGLGAFSAPAEVKTDSLTSHPVVAKARQSVDWVNKRLDYHRFGNVEAGIQVTEGYTNDMGDGAGHYTMAGIDFTVPLHWKKQRESQYGRDEGRLREAREQYRQALGQLTVEGQESLEQWQVQQDALNDQLRRYESAAEVLRLARLRLQAFDGDGYARLIEAQHGLHSAALEAIEAARELDVSSARLWYYQPACSLEKVVPDQAEGLARRTEETLQGNDAIVLSGKMARPHAETATGAKPDAIAINRPQFKQHLNADTAASAAASSGPTEKKRWLGWYAWRGMAIVNQPEMLKQMPPVTNRVLLSFMTDEWHLVIQKPERLQALATLARQRGIRLELLLGEPHWVLPEERGHLIAMLRQIPANVFTAVHLDLERGQLPTEAQKNWRQNLLATLKEATAASLVPISLTTHWRELAEQSFMAEVRGAGATEITPMIYIADAAETCGLAKGLPTPPKGLRLAIAQSVERALPDGESSFVLGRSRAMAMWQNLVDCAQAIPGFSGVAVQSWEDYMEAKP